VIRKLAVVLAFLTIGAATGFAQSPAPAAAVPPGPPQPPAGRGGRGGGAPITSPDVAADGRVTFRLRAPMAKQVAVAMGGAPLPMEKNDQGLWTVTTDVLKPDYYTYSFVVDGTTINDPANREMQTSFGSAQSMLVVPGPQPWLPQRGVPHGAIARHTFHSAIANDDRDFFVYTPPGYDARRSRPYPVLYLLHGLGDDAGRWLNGGAANVILDNLIAQGKAVPMLIVTPLGYGLAGGPQTAMAPEMMNGYARILLEEVMPRVDKAYNVTKSREERALAGLSMGGAETMYTGLNHLDRFAWLGSFSGAYVMWPGASPSAPAAGAATPARGGRGAGPQVMDEAAFAKNFPTLDTKANSQLRMLWIVCGTADSLIGVNRQFKTWLKSKNVQFTEQEVPDMAHVWPLWRQNLTDMARKLFQPKK
jgi:enterochelin esterase family protein